MDSKKDKCIMTNKIMPKYSLETLAKISKFKYFGHIMHRLDSLKNE